jgi:hypothetical protein
MVKEIEALRLGEFGPVQSFPMFFIFFLLNEKFSDKKCTGVFVKLL